MARVLVFGTFDVLHPGHLKLLELAKRYGRVTISLAPDAVVTSLKGAAPVQPFTERRRRLLDMASIDEVIASDTVPGRYGVVASVRPDVVVLGHDQVALRPAILAASKRAPRVVIAPAYRRAVYASSKLQHLT